MKVLYEGVNELSQTVIAVIDVMRTEKGYKRCKYERR